MLWVYDLCEDRYAAHGRLFDPASLGTALTIAAGSTTASIAGSRLLAKKPPTPPVTPLPDINDPAEQDAKRREREELTARRGRQSTILGDERGGRDDAYRNSVLGD